MRYNAILIGRKSRQITMRSYFVPHSGLKCDVTESLPPGEHLFASVDS